MSEDICVTINGLGGVNTEIETPDVEVNFLKSAIYTDPSAIIYNTDKFANAITGKVEKWDGTGILLDDVSPLREVTIDSNFIDEMTVTSCGRNVLRENEIVYPIPSDVYNIFQGNLKGYLYLGYDKSYVGNYGQSTILRVYYLGEWRRGAPDGKLETFVNNDPTVFANILANTASKHYFNGTITRIDVLNWAGLDDGSKLKNLQLFIGEKLPDRTIVTGDFETKFANFEPYKQGETVFIEGHGIGKLKPISPNMTLYSDVPDGEYRIDYNKDTNVVINKLTQAIIALGGNI